MLADELLEARDFWSENSEAQAQIDRLIDILEGRESSPVIEHTSHSRPYLNLVFVIITRPS